MASTIKRRAAPLIMLAALISLSLAAPALAHQGEHHSAAVATETTTTTTTTQTPADGQDMSGMPMSGAEMSWPTEAPDTGMMGMHHARPTTFAGRVIAWLGAWHPAVVHFPIALLLTVAFLELAAALRRKPIYNAANKILLALAALSALVAAPLGWADAGMPTPQDEWFLVAHRWLGTAIPFVMLLLWRLKAPAEQAAAKPSPPLYESLLVVSVLIVLAQAYLGGEITHGANHMAF